MGPAGPEVGEDLVPFWGAGQHVPAIRCDKVGAGCGHLVDRLKNQQWQTETQKQRSKWKTPTERSKPARLAAPAAPKRGEEGSPKK